MRKLLTVALLGLAISAPAYAETYTKAAEKVKRCRVEAWATTMVLEAKNDGIPKDKIVAIALETPDVLAKKLLLNASENVYKGAYAGKSVKAVDDFIFSKCIEVQFK